MNLDYFQNGYRDEDEPEPETEDQPEEQTESIPWTLSSSSIPRKPAAVAEIGNGVYVRVGKARR